MLHEICEKREEQQRSGRTVNVNALINEIAGMAPQRHKVQVES
jgi:hypothetical protein